MLATYFLLVITSTGILLSMYKNINMFSSKPKETEYQIDVVYIWTNKSDEHLQAQKLAYITNMSEASLLSENYDLDSNLNDLKYSLRSLLKYAPWVRTIFIVTNGQVPDWLDRVNPKVRIVTHAKMFPNRSHLPTFSHSAVRTHLHRIPELSTRFVLFDKNQFLTTPTYPSDFYSLDSGIKIRLSSKPISNRNDTFSKSVIYANNFMDETYGRQLTGYRKLPARTPFLVDREIMFAMQEKFTDAFERTSSHRFRQAGDLPFAFSYVYFVIHENKWPFQIETNNKSWYFVSGVKENSSKSMERKLTKIMRHRRKFTCVSDKIAHRNDSLAEIYRFILINFYETIFPEFSELEL